MDKIINMSEVAAKKEAEKMRKLRERFILKLTKGKRKTPIKYFS